MTNPHEYPGLEILARQAFERARDMIPDKEVGMIVLLSHFGTEGGFAYLSTIERSDAVALVVEWIDRTILEADGDFQRRVRDSITEALDR